ncbi:alanyl-tRNA synthetase [Desulfacinum hydrothermale DSM 13146]|uniref:Alanine--tRNA ligase n=1 Tax=Desulfacinum hydrothermale DSM 13146 TaxID=1121390 RepID=A0A1W1XCL4_9BACT|nr:alanine--tRNA ligase [Desulfacinum hydrothermale]SMC21582.1 alanyl-tRNA synthetase [Desulfacinum hydrothermale DSM 13146]
MKAREIRKKFLEYFQEHGHAIVKSSSLIPHDDPTLLFTNAGMNQFKRCFLGEEKRPYTRATTSQKCMRAGGKHNDLENVGYTARHHTFFEMLGNFSFGDYFKEEAIQFAWEFLTEHMGLPQDKLYATIHEGDAAMNLGPDQEAEGFWKRFLPEGRILKFPTKDNFWAMGDTGPCGPCSEILIDQGEAMGCGRPDCRPGCDCDRYLELWNLVFMQFNRTEDGVLHPLPKPSIDTGMGLERIAAVIQKVPSNYDTDLFAPMMEAIGALSGLRYGTDPEKDASFRVIADHGRAAAFLIGDGVLPSNEGRGYVLRRVIRRALRHGRFLGLDRPFLHQVVVAVMESMADTYPELLENKSYITKVILHEEERFSETLDHGLRLLQNEMNRLRDEGSHTVPGELIFKLYDTYGFPIDIVTDMARKMGMQVDEAGFEDRMEKQREQSRKHWKGSGEREISKAYRSLASQGVRTEFVGYEQLEAQARVLALVRGGNLVESAAAGSEVEVVVDRTPFYGEAGGQVGDTGRLEGPQGEAVITDTLRLPGDIWVHVARLEKGSLTTGESVTLRVDAQSRNDTALNHTATHILHRVLRDVLGDHVKQSGSLVAPERFRFDFTHFAAPTEEELREIERRVNQAIRENRPLQVKIMGFEEAVRSGAVALFEEKYGDTVRLVEILDFSKELCGGTHTQRTGDIGTFVIVQETSVAAGVRRIEAMTGRHALAYWQKQRETLSTAARRLKSLPEEVPDKVQRLLSHNKDLEKELEALKASLTAQKSADLLDRAQEIGGVQVLVSRVQATNPKALREINDRFKERISCGVVVLGAAHDAKVFLLVGVTKDLTPRIHAGEIVKEVAQVVGGSGGGRPDMAQAGGSRPEKLEEALERARAIIREKLS